MLFLLSPEEVQTAKDYAARLLHDFYDDRETALSVLRAKSRVSDDDKPVEYDHD